MREGERGRVRLEEAAGLPAARRGLEADSPLGLVLQLHGIEPPGHRLDAREGSEGAGGAAGGRSPSGQARAASARLPGRAQHCRPGEAGSVGLADCTARPPLASGVAGGADPHATAATATAREPRAEGSAPTGRALSRHAGAAGLGAAARPAASPRRALGRGQAGETSGAARPPRPSGGGCAGRPNGSPAEQARGSTGTARDCPSTARVVAECPSALGPEWSPTGALCAAGTRSGSTRPHAW